MTEPKAPSFNGVAMPEVEMIRAPCPRCGAAREGEAIRRCQPYTDETGERSCPGEQTDAGGYLLQPSPESLAALDAWIEGAAS